MRAEARGIHMKKVGILTFHFADNYGAVLQCYALRALINSLPDCKADIINYIPPGFRYMRTWQNTFEELMFKKKREKFEKFLCEKCSVYSPKVSSVTEGNSYDYYVAGSDQIWNTDPKWNEYFLPNIPEGAVRIAYAPSIGRDLSSPRVRQSVLKEGASRFDALSVRETAHVLLIEKLTGKKCQWVLDPVLLLEKKEYLPLVSEEKLRSRPYVFLFMLNHDINVMQGVTLANDLSRYFGLEIVHSLNWAPQSMFYANNSCMQFEGIENFLWYIMNAEYIVTNSYHATLFSILFQKSFFVIRTETMNSRIETLKEKLHISDRVVDQLFYRDKILVHVDYDDILYCVEKEKKDSLAFLKRSLNIFC